MSSSFIRSQTSEMYLSAVVITQFAIVCLEMFTSFLENSCSCLYRGMAFVYLPFITADTSDGVAILPLSISLGCSAFTIFPFFPLQTATWCSCTSNTAGISSSFLYTSSGSLLYPSGKCSESSASVSVCSMIFESKYIRSSSSFPLRLRLLCSPTITSSIAGSIDNCPSRRLSASFKISVKKFNWFSSI